MVTGSHSSIVTLNVNELNAPTKRHRLAECIPKQDPYIYCLLEIHLKPRDMNKLKAIKKTVIGIYILIITLSLNGLNAPIKRNGIPSKY